MAISTGLAILGSSLVGGFLQNRSASRQARAGESAADAGIAEQRAARLAFEERTQPFLDIGLNAGGLLTDFLNNPMAGLDEINPIISFLREQGFEGIEESAAARGRLGAGDTLKDLVRFDVGLTSTVVPQLQQQRFNQLFNVTGLGANAAVGQGNAALSTASNISNLFSNRGQATQQGIQGQTNALTGFLSNLSGVAGAFPGLFGMAAPPKLM